MAQRDTCVIVGHALTLLLAVKGVPVGLGLVVVDLAKVLRNGRLSLLADLLQREAVLLGVPLDVVPASIKNGISSVSTHRRPSPMPAQPQRPPRGPCEGPPPPYSQPASSRPTYQALWFHISASSFSNRPLCSVVTPSANSWSLRTCAFVRLGACWEGAGWPWARRLEVDAAGDSAASGSDERTSRDLLASGEGASDDILGGGAGAG